MSTAPIPTYPIVYADVAGDGSAHVNVAGRHKNFGAAGRATTRQRVTAYAAAVAGELHRPVRMRISDPDGKWLVAVHPDGTVTDLADAPKNFRPRRQDPTVSTPHAEPAVAPRPTAPPPVISPVSAPDQLPDRVEEPLDRSPAPELFEVSELERTTLLRRPAAPPKEAADPTATLTFSTGEVARVTGAVLIGRRPSADAGEDVELTVTVDDESRKLSRTHLRIEWHDGNLWATDRGSGNGTTIERAEASPTELISWQPFRLHDQDVAVLGDVHVTISLKNSTAVDL